MKLHRNYSACLIYSPDIVSKSGAEYLHEGTATKGYSHNLHTPNCQERIFLDEQLNPLSNYSILRHRHQMH